MILPDRRNDTQSSVEFLWCVTSSLVKSNISYVIMLQLWLVTTMLRNAAVQAAALGMVNAVNV